MHGGVEIDNRARILVITTLFVAAADQAVKAAIMHSLLENQFVTVIPGLLNIVHFRNPGAAFGIFTDGGTLKTLFLTGTSVVALVVIWFLVKSAPGRLAVFALSLIAGGAVGNLIDRIRFAEVVDFIDFHVGRYHWPAFNVADSAITVGVILALVAYYLWPDDGTERPS